MERTLYLRSKVRPPSLKTSGSCFSSAAASAAFLSSHVRPSARLSAASAGSALIPASRTMVPSNPLVLSRASTFLGSPASAGAASHATAASRISLRARRDAARFTAIILCRETDGDAALFRRLAMAEPRVELVDQFLGGVRDHGAGREDRLGAGLVQRVVILRGHHAADDDHDVLAALFLQRGLELRHGGEMRGGERRQPQNMHVVLDRLPCRFVGGRE